MEYTTMPQVAERMHERREPIEEPMVAAVQPFLSGGMSKTVPLPADTTVEAIEEVFIEVWRMGLKSIVVYRGGSKLEQPLTEDEG